MTEIKLADTTRKFLEKVGERTKADFRDLGKPTPDHAYDMFKILSMLEICLGEASPKTLTKVNCIADWKQ